jgi:hypothetical protein
VTPEDKINAIYEAMLGNEFEEGFVKKFNRYCKRVQRLEIAVVGLICTLVGMGILEWSKIIGLGG